MYRFNMKKSIKYILATSLISSLLPNIYAQQIVTSPPGVISLEPTINKITFDFNSGALLVNGTPYTEALTFIKDDLTTWVPIRLIGNEIISAYTSTEGSYVRINCNNSLYILKADEKTVLINDQPAELQYSPFIRNGKLMLSVEDLKTLFDIETSYSDDGSIITLSGEDRRPNTPPTASFYFMKSHYVEGQQVTAVNISTDSDGDAIIDYRWCVGKDNATISHNLSDIFKLPKAGTYTIGLQVQDKRGLWSEWAYSNITIFANRSPVITAFHSTKDTFAPGEALSFNYSYDNEEWEGIVNEKWMYYKTTEDKSLAVLGKPDRFFTPGDYIVTLEIDDASGKRSKLAQTTVHIQGEKLADEFEYHFTQSSIGTRIDNYANLNFRNYKDTVITNSKQVDGTLIMSDSPETVTDLGILYEESISGNGRILIHHLNKVDTTLTSGKKQKLALVASNPSNQPITFIIQNKAIKGPATDIGRIGQKVVFDYFTGNEDETITLAPGEKTWIYSQAWTNGGCISGLLDVQTSEKVSFTIAAITGDITLDNFDELKHLPSDNIHPSGTYNCVGITYDLLLDGHEPTKLLLGANGNEEWLVGYDNRTDELAYNKGNYGVSYYITITATEDIGILLNSRGSGIRGAIKWNDKEIYNIPTDGGLSKTTTKAAVIGTIKAGETKTLEYMLPNGSSAPILIGFIPKSFWSSK